MTRYDAKQEIEKITKIKIISFKGIDLAFFIDRIYDDFENKLCKNCKYLKIFTDKCAKDKTYYCNNCKEFIYCIDKLSCNEF